VFIVQLQLLERGSYTGTVPRYYCTLRTSSAHITTSRVDEVVHRLRASQYVSACILVNNLYTMMYVLVRSAIQSKISPITCTKQVLQVLSAATTSISQSQISPFAAALRRHWGGE